MTGALVASGQGPDQPPTRRGGQNFIDRTGQVFGRLTVIERGPNDKRNRTRWWCRCTCGITTLTYASSLCNGQTRSCGCYRRERVSRHGRTNTPIWKTWVWMKTRGTNPNIDSAKYYVLRGITVCERWLVFENFYTDIIASIGEHPGEGWSLDRISPDKNYTPGNVRWLPRREQARTTRRSTPIEKVREIKRLGLEGILTRAEISQLLDVRQNIVGNIVTGRTHANVEPASGIHEQAVA